MPSLTWKKSNASAPADPDQDTPSEPSAKNSSLPRTGSKVFSLFRIGHRRSSRSLKEPVEPVDPLEHAQSPSPPPEIPEGQVINEQTPHHLSASSPSSTPNRPADSSTKNTAKSSSAHASKSLPKTARTQRPPRLRPATVPNPTAQEDSPLTLAGVGPFRRSSSRLIQPQHLLTEDYTSPVLDSTVELITSQDFNDVDVVQLNHNTPKTALLRSVHRGNSGPPSRRQSEAATATATVAASPLGTKPATFFVGSSRSSTSGESSPQPENKAMFAVPPPVIGSSAATTPLGPVVASDYFGSVGSNATSPDTSRKSISYYSYSDLVRFEKCSRLSRDLIMSPAKSVKASRDITEITPLGMGDSVEMMDGGRSGSVKQRVHSKLSEAFASESKEPKESQESQEPKEQNDDAFDIFSITSGGADHINSISSTNDDGESIKGWTPKNNNNNGPDGYASLEAYFQPEAAGAAEDDDLINVCTARDFLNSRSRELHSSFGNDAQAAGKTSFAS